MLVLFTFFTILDPFIVWRASVYVMGVTVSTMFGEVYDELDR